MQKILTYLNPETGNIIVFDNETSYSVNKKHPKYDYIQELCRKDDPAVIELLKVPHRVDVSNDQVSVSQDTVTHNGKKFTNRKMVECIRKWGGLSDPVKKFINKCTENPNVRSIEMLMDFLAHNHLPLTEDGCFLAYKAVKNNYHDKHSGKFDFSPGKTVEMKRSEVEFNPDVACSTGFHAGTHEYATDYMCVGDRLVLVLIHPYDVVSVPKDSSCMKLRAMKIKSIGDCTEVLCDQCIYTVEGTTQDWADYVADIRENVERLLLNLDNPLSPDDDDDDDDDEDWDDVDDEDDNCPYCGFDLYDGVLDRTTCNFCPSCGRKLE
jgi:hypothetical protein